MIFSRSVLLLIIATATSHHAGDDEEKDKEVKILKLLNKLGTDDVEGHEPIPFIFNQPNLYTNEGALRKFTEYYTEGFIPKDGAFSSYDLKISRDTSSLADLLYFAKDFNVFYEIASWAKSEIHPVQFFYGLVTAILHREDTKYIILPPIYEVLPNYFLPSTVINGVYRAKLNGINERKFLVNNTGWESGRDFTFWPIFDRNSYQNEHESILSYYREDVSRSDFFFKYFKKMDTRMSDQQKYGRKLERLEEWHCTAFKWILTRYNLERYAVGLPSVIPLNVFGEINAGYDSQIMDLYGRYLSSRPDEIYLQGVDKDYSFGFEKTFRNDQGYSSHNMQTKPKLDGNQMKIFINKGYYSRLYNKILGIVDSSSLSSNNKFSQGVLRNDMIRMRDPVYYQVLAYIDHIMRTMQDNSPYLTEELAFPGVEINYITIPALQTYFENYDFDISNAVPGKDGKYTASQFRINHKPFHIILKINSAIETSGIVKIFFGIPKDSLNEIRQSLTLIDTFKVKLNKGDNVIARNPEQNELTSTPLNTQNILDGLYSSSDPHQNQCSYPRNLLLPKGSPGGTPFKLFAIVYPSDNMDEQTEQSRTCGRDYLTRDKTRSIPFPVDKPWLSSILQLSNVKMITPKIYHVNNK